MKTFEPKLVFHVKPSNGFPVDAYLSPETRSYLQSLTTRTGSPLNTIVQGLDDDGDPMPEALSTVTRDRVPGQPTTGTEPDSGNFTSDPIQSDYQKVEVPLRYDSEFFHILNIGVSGLHDLQTHERSALTKEICKLGQDISKLASPSHGSNKNDLYAWRAVFSLYTESKIFLSTAEQDDFHRDSLTAQRQLQNFSTKLSELKATKKFCRKESFVALERFLLINFTLLRNLKFQELNSTAMTKILKSKLSRVLVTNGI